MTSLICHRAAAAFGALGFVLCSAAWGLASEAPSVSSPLRVSGEAGSVALLELDRDAYEGLRGADRVVLSGVALDPVVRVDLDLIQRRVFTDSTVVVEGTDFGDVEVSAPDVLILAGTVSGDPGSSAFLALSPFGTNGYVEMDGQTFIISSGRAGDGEALEAHAFNLSALPEGTITWVDHVCHADRLMQMMPEQAERRPLEDGALRSGLACRVARVAVDCDRQFYTNLFGSNLEAALAYAATLVGANSFIYERDIGVYLDLVFLRVWTSVNNPYNNSDIVDELFNFRNYWRNNMTHVSYDGAHLFSGRNLGGGVAWLQTLCGNNYPYALSANLNGFFPNPLQNNSPQNWDVMVTAHEWGHNFGAPHTHDVTPRIDGCGAGNCSGASNGTIMSYCHLCSGGMSNIVLRFHERMIAERIMPYMNSGSCGSLSAAPASIVTEPEGVSACAGETVVLSVGAAGDGDLRYQWTRNLAAIPGATGPTLTLENVDASKAGTYRVLVSNHCDTVLSAPAEVVVSPGCPADFTGDCSVDIFDLLAFLDAFDAEESRADLAAPFGVFDVFDVITYLQLFEAGCD